MDGNASVLLCAASVAPNVVPSTVIMAAAADDADAMSEITNDGERTNRTAAAAATATAATAAAGGPIPRTPCCAAATPRTVMSVAATATHLVPLEGMWYRMDVREHWANIVTVLFQRYCEYMDRVSVRATKDQQLALLTGRAKCCNATERSKMRVAFYDALTKIPGAILE